MLSTLVALLTISYFITIPLIVRIIYFKKKKKCPEFFRYPSSVKTIVIGLNLSLVLTQSEEYNKYLEINIIVRGYVIVIVIAELVFTLFFENKKK